MSQIISRLDSLIKQRHDDIVDWFALQYKEQSPFFYSSVDLRHSGHKLAPVDTNLFPAGWNNISEEGCKRAVAQIKKRFDSMKTPVNNVLIIPENHTRNLAYLENLAVLQDLVEQSGRQVRIAGLTLEEPLTLTTMSGREITEYPLQRKYDILATKDGFIPDFIILNNDCTSGIPEILQGIKQEIQPHFDIGWHARRKSEHFRAYEQVAKDFSEDFGFDYRLISAAFHRCGVVNFREQKGIECVAIGVEKVLHNVRNQYAEYGIKDEPYVFVKADSGTYGMGIMTVRSGDELLEINKKTRNKMNVIKEGTQNS
ncbi:MAG: glutamate--cysteine ligase, partial [Pseudomonadota bacterium]